MALTQIYDAQTGDTITAARWDNEFGNIYNNGTDVAFPLTKAVSFGGFTITWDASGNTTMISSASQGIQYTPGSKTGTPSTTGGVFNSAASTFTDNNTSGSGTAASWAGWAIQRPTLAASNSSVTTTDAATLYIANSPAEGTNDTITNEWAQWVDAGAVRFDGNMWVQGELVANPNPYRFTATVAAKALTITLQDVNGNTPTASSPVPLVFRNATLTTPALSTVLVTAATTVVVPSGGTLGFTAAMAGRIYIVALNNAGTVELAVYNPYVATAELSGLSETVLNSSTTIGTGSDSAGVLYSTTGRSNVAIRVLGYIDITTGAVAGEWDNEDTVIQMMQDGVQRTGDIVRAVQHTRTDTATGTTAIPRDNTVPLITEGDQYLVKAIVPTAAVNLLHIEVQLFGAHSANAELQATLFQDANACSTTWTVTTGVGQVAIIRGDYWMVAGTTSSTSFQVRAGGANGATFTFNGQGGAQMFNNTMQSYLRITEVCY